MEAWKRVFAPRFMCGAFRFNGRAMADLSRRTSVKDYDEERRSIDRRIVSRLSRGNVRLQSGLYMMREDLDESAREADEALSELQAQLKKSQ